ncbi:MAG TPA: methyltransferase domain-containing protein [Luteolibacter sp.]|nr:methyltransferase domain-containing protein [Luteolibacter sp.]
MDWADRYLQDDTPWDKGIATPVLAEMHARHPGVFSGKTVAPGCGTGHDARSLADLGCEVTGLDIAPPAIERAKALDPEQRVTFEVADFLNPSPEYHHAFDLLWEHTCLCALDPTLRPAYLAAVADVVKPGGRVAGVFFINPEMDDGESGPPFGISVDDLQSSWERHGFQVIDSWVPETAFPGRLGRELAMILTKGSG